MKTSTGSIIGPPTVNADLYGIGFQNTKTPLIEYHESDLPDGGNLKLQDNILTPASNPNSRIETDDAGDAALANYLGRFYAENPGYNGGTFLFLRFNPDAATRGQDSTYAIYSANDSSKPVLAITTAEAPPPLVFDLADWSDTSNPNGVWSYNEGNNPLPHVEWWQRLFGGWTNPQPAWAESEDSINRLPVWLRSNGSEAFPHDWLPGECHLDEPFHRPHLHLRRCLDGGFERSRQSLEPFAERSRTNAGRPFLR